MTTDESSGAPSIAQAITGRVMIKTAVLAGVAAVLGLLYSLFVLSAAKPWSLPAGILFGAVLGLLNFRWLARAVERLYLKKGTHAAVSITAAEILHLLKLIIVFIILFIVIKFQLVHLLGLIVGISLCFIAILWEGLTAMRGLQQ